MNSPNAPERPAGGGGDTRDRSFSGSRGAGTGESVQPAGAPSSPRGVQAVRFASPAVERGPSPGVNPEPAVSSTVPPDVSAPLVRLPRLEEIMASPSRSRSASRSQVPGARPKGRAQANPPSAAPPARELSPGRRGWSPAPGPMRAGALRSAPGKGGPQSRKGAGRSAEREVRGRGRGGGR